MPTELRIPSVSLPAFRDAASDIRGAGVWEGWGLLPPHPGMQTSGGIPITIHSVYFEDSPSKGLRVRSDREWRDPEGPRTGLVLKLSGPKARQILYQTA